MNSLSFHSNEVNPAFALSQSPMRHLPPELYQMICHRLDAEDFSRLPRVCRLFHDRQNTIILSNPRLLEHTIAKARSAGGHDFSKKVLRTYLDRFAGIQASPLVISILNTGQEAYYTDAAYLPRKRRAFN